MNLTNVECRNFLNDYESLIHVENDNLITISKGLTLVGSHYGSRRVSGKIHIGNSKFIDSSFTYGMLFLTPRKPLAMEYAKVLVYTYCDNEQESSQQTYMNDQAYL